MILNTGNNKNHTDPKQNVSESWCTCAACGHPVSGQSLPFWVLECRLLTAHVPSSNLPKTCLFCWCYNEKSWGVFYWQYNCNGLSCVLNLTNLKPPHEVETRIRPSWWCNKTIHTQVRLILSPANILTIIELLNITFMPIGHYKQAKSVTRYSTIIPQHCHKISTALHINRT